MFLSMLTGELAATPAPAYVGVVARPLGAHDAPQGMYEAQGIAAAVERIVEVLGV